MLWGLVHWGFLALADTGTTSSAVTIIVGLLTGTFALAAVTYIVERRKGIREEQKNALSARLENYTKREERDSLIAEASARAVAFMRDELEHARRELNETREEVERLRQEGIQLRKEVTLLQAMVDHAVDERTRAKNNLEAALADLARSKIHEQQLEDRVKILEAGVSGAGLKASDRPPETRPPETK